MATAGNGEDGVDKAKQLLPDLIITDALMPGIDGFELIHRLKSHPPTSTIPVVMLTSGDFKDAEYADRVPQPDAYVAKAMQLDPLLKRVAELLKN